MTFPKEHRAKLHGTNPIERLNGEIKRRTDAVGPRAFLRTDGRNALDSERRCHRPSRRRTPARTERRMGRSARPRHDAGKRRPSRRVTRGDGASAATTPAFRITPSICLSSSSRSVMTSTRASGSRSRIHLASSTIRMLLPDPWVCQMTPPSRLASRSCASFTPTNWCCRGTFLMPASKITKFRIRSSSRSLRSICPTGRSSSAPASRSPAGGSSSRHSTNSVSGVPTVP